MAEGKVRAKKSLGQNFLNDPKIVYRFIETLDPSRTDTFVEIGPGKGAVTFRLLPRVSKVIAIEKDDDLVARLAEVATQKGLTNLEVIHSDYFDVSSDKQLGSTYISSLPYNVAKKILFSLLYERTDFQKGAFIIQKEVAEDYCSTVPNTSFLSRVVGLVAECEYMFTIPPEKFTPAPKVTSAVIRISRKEPLMESRDEQVAFLKFVRELYQFKRKVIRNSLKKKLSTQVADELVLKFGLSEKRIEEVSLDTLVALYTLVKKEGYV